MRVSSLRVFAIAAVVVAAFGTTGFTAAAATEPGDSAITVSWLNDASPAAQFQPSPRDPASIHFEDLKNVKVTVSQTRGLVDQVIRVDVSGLPGATREAEDTGLRANAYDFVQAMQCWGDPQEPTFYETCQWGGMMQGGGAAVAEMPYGSTYRGAPQTDIPFRTAWHETVASVPYNSKTGSPFHRDFTAATTNEILAARVGADGSGWFNFETQTADSAPHLGCGDDSNVGAGTRCWLVVIPRGEHTAPTSDKCPTDMPVTTASAIGKMQFGSPINPACGYWDNRMLVPLDFQPTGDTCPPGSAERRTAGASLVQAAMSSWQPELCQDLGSTFSYNSIPDPVARDQLVAGQIDLAFTGAPVTPSTLSAGTDPSVLDGIDFVYAPVTVSGPVIGFYAATKAEGRVEELKLTPRLVAKLLTQSYSLTVPWNNSSANFEHLRATATLWDDPEFTAINSGSYWSATGVGAMSPGLVMVVSGSDAIEQLWNWIRADDEARAFLSGAADEAGNQINPFYLPKGHRDAHVVALEEVPNSHGNTTLQPKPGEPPRQVGLTNVDGSPMCLCDTALNTFPVADETLAPRELNQETRRFDSLQYNPLVNSFAEVAINVQRGNKNMKTEWSPIAINAAGESGDWIAGPNGVGGSARFLAGVTDSAFLERYGLSAAQLQIPNRPGVFAAPTQEGLSAALSAQVPTAVSGVTRTDMTQLADNAYPLTMVTYAAVNLTASDVDSRADYANLLERVTTTGQIPGTVAGTLPAGYAPLTEAMKSQAAVAVQTIRDYAEPSTDSDPLDQETQTPTSDGFDGGASVTDIVGPDDEQEMRATATPGSPATPVGIVAFGGISLLGAGGLACAPFLLRRKGTP